MSATRRNRRAGVEDLWFKSERREDGTTKKVPTQLHEKGKRWRARYVDDAGQEHTKRFTKKAEAETWLTGQMASVIQGTHVAPKDARATVGEWADTWLGTYIARPRTVTVTKSQVTVIKADIGHVQMAQLRPSTVKAWVARLNARGHEPSYVHALHARLSQVLGDAVRDGMLARNPCSKHTSPPAGKPKVYCATTAQVWAVHDAMPECMRSAVLLGAFAGLRISEVGGLRREDVDFMRGIVHPHQQWGGGPLKTRASEAPIPVPNDLALLLSAALRKFPGPHVVNDEFGKPVSPERIEKAIRGVRPAVGGLPPKFSFHDLRHFYASALIAAGSNIKVVQARLRHESATTTLDTYGHMWPDTDESSKAAIAAVIAARPTAPGATAYSLRTDG
ncbi:tyrosine-type recombinase/integrase [Nocardia sp. alder85J]|uniref:tyrosine-type recombinase/integrase n=1 Tax=Nocardia sp. alder85J TaxID=2862949 RepID=UPI001CD63F73|nr:site-specific integrase [Nocardia sp. alder85J]MCX4095348.1 site-specific integrase [Nocardia sp. alder85J]